MSPSFPTRCEAVRALNGGPSALGYRHVLGSTHHEACTIVDFSHQLVIGQPVEEVSYRYRGFEPGQSHAQAVVQAEAETEMALLFAVYVEHVAISIFRRIAIGGAEHPVDVVAFAQFHAAHFDRLAARPDRKRTRLNSRH